MPLRIRLPLFLIALNLLWLAGLIRTLRRRPLPARAVVTTAVAVAALIALAAGASVAVESAVAHPTAAVIVADQVVARRGDSDAYDPSFAAPLHAGTELRLLQQRNGWYHAALADGRRAWLPIHAVAVVGAARVSSNDGVSISRTGGTGG